MLGRRGISFKLIDKKSQHKYRRKAIKESLSEKSPLTFSIKFEKQSDACMHQESSTMYIHHQRKHTQVPTHLCGEVWEHSSRWVCISFVLKIKKDLQKLPLLEGYN